jgi:hypothetical protein
MDFSFLVTCHLSLVTSLNRLGIDERLLLIYIGYGERLFRKYIRVDQRLHNVIACGWKSDVGKDSDVIGKAIGRDLKR